MLAHAEYGYTANLPLADITTDHALVAYAYEGEDIEPIHGGPVRLVVPHLYFWKSAKWVRGLELRCRRPARLLGAQRLPHLRRPLPRAALLGRLRPTRAGRPPRRGERHRAAKTLEPLDAARMWVRARSCETPSSGAKVPGRSSASSTCSPPSTASPVVCASDTAWRSVCRAASP